MPTANKKRQAPSLSRVYTHVNDTKPPSYYDYENFSPIWKPPDNYEIVRKVGRGKYSEVFEGIDTRTNKKIIIKILKPVKKRKIKREIRILLNLQGATNVIKLLDTCRDPVSRTCSLIFEHVANKDFKVLFPKLSDLEVRHYLFELLKGLDDCHARGIMHRDVKPHNVMIDNKTKELRLIDWGLAEFYHAHQEYNVRVASRYFKGPELLVDMRQYDYSLDLWSFGCMMAGMCFIVHPFFHGRDNEDQLVRITKVLGTEALLAYLEQYKLKLSAKLLSRCKGYQQVAWFYWRTKNNKHLCSDEALDLLSKCLVFDHAARLTCKEAMAHPYFDPIRNNSLIQLPAEETKSNPPQPMNESEDGI